MSCRGFEPVCTNDEARSYFRDKGLRYADITDGDIAVLAMFLSEEIKKSNKAGETSVNTMYLSKKISITHKPNGTIIRAFLYMNSHYFTQRECISFNEGGFIGFAGWADEGNTNPIRRAFLRWCDKMDEQKQHMMADQFEISETEDQITIAKDAIALLKEHEAMVKPTKCPCGELFDANDSSFCPKCGCAYGELSGRYTNIGR